MILSIIAKTIGRKLHDYMNFIKSLLNEVIQTTNLLVNNLFQILIWRKKEDMSVVHRKTQKLIKTYKL